MSNFFIILLSRTFTSIDETKDRVLKCNSDIYSDVQNYIKEFINNSNLLYSFIEKSCDITKHLYINSTMLPRYIIIPSNVNDMIDVIIQYNNTYFEHKKITSDNTEDLICSINNIEWSNWMLDNLNNIYKLICRDYCIAQPNQSLLHNIKYILNEIDRFCNPHTTTINSSSINTTNNYSDHNITNTTDDDLYFNTHDFLNPINWIKIATVGVAGIFTIYCSKKIIDYIQKQYYTPNTNDNIELQDGTILSHVHIVGTPNDAIQKYQEEQCINDQLYEDIEGPLYENVIVSTIGNIYENIPY